MQRCARLRSAVALDDALAGLETAAADNPSITLSQTSIDARYTKDFDERNGARWFSLRTIYGARQYVVLAMLEGRKAQKRTATGIDRSTLADLVKRLVTAGYVRRKRSKTDARV